MHTRQAHYSWNKLRKAGDSIVLKALSGSSDPAGAPPACPAEGVVGAGAGAPAAALPRDATSLLTSSDASLLIDSSFTWLTFWGTCADVTRTVTDGPEVGSRRTQRQWHGTHRVPRQGSGCSCQCTRPVGVSHLQLQRLQCPQPLVGLLASTDARTRAEIGLLLLLLLRLLRRRRPLLLTLRLLLHLLLRLLLLLLLPHRLLRLLLLLLLLLQLLMPWLLMWLLVLLLGLGQAGVSALCPARPLESLHIVQQLHGRCKTRLSATE